MIRAIILTGGKGTRLQLSLPKQFYLLNNKPLFIMTLEKFITHPLIDEVVLVYNEEFKDLYTKYLKEFSYQSKVKMVTGGETRQLSVYNGLQYLMNKNHSNEDIVIIHDGSRPFVSQTLITKTINSCQLNQASAVAITHLNDTIIDRKYKLLKKENVLVVQTPQTFIFTQLYAWHKKLFEQGITNLTDDGQIAKMNKAEVCYIEGEKTNIKVTDQEDLDLIKNFEGK